MANKKILFLPVSSSQGMGEYARSLCIARALQNKYENSSSLHMAFALNRHANYLSSCPFQVFELSASPTLCTPEVLAIFDEYKPDLVFFDASGRVTQLEYCYKKNIKTVYMAQHPKKLNRALNFRRLRYTDKIFVAQTKELGKSLTQWQRIKLTCMNKPLPEYVGPVFGEQSVEAQKACLESYGLNAGEYIFFNAGGGGNFLPSKAGAILAVDFLLEVAQALVEQIDYPIVLVAGKNYVSQKKPALNKTLNKKCIFIDSCESEIFNTLLRHARMNVLSGGGALLQALACGQRNIIALAVASDQNERIKSCVKQFHIIQSACNHEELINKIVTLLEKTRMQQSTNKKNLSDTSAETAEQESALERIVSEVEKLLQLKQSTNQLEYKAGSSLL